MFVLLHPVVGVLVYFAPPLVRSCMLEPEQIVVSLDTLATILPTVTRTVSYAIHPCSLVTVRMYWVVVLGEAFGLAMLGLSRSVVGNHEYLLPASGLSPSCAEELGQMVLSVPALAVGFGIDRSVDIRCVAASCIAYN